MGIYSCTSCDFYQNETSNAPSMDQCANCGMEMKYIEHPTNVTIVSFKTTYSQSKAYEIIDSFPLIAKISSAEFAKLDKLPFLIFSKVNREMAIDIKVKLEKAGVGCKLAPFVPIMPKDQQKKRSVLIVEDSPGIRKQLVEILQFNNYNIDEAVDGFDALAKLRKIGPIDLIISDINMPKLDGLKFVGMVKKNSKYKHIPIIMLTTKNESEDILRAVQLGVKGYLIKPINEKVLLKKIKEFI